MLLRSWLVLLFACTLLPFALRTAFCNETPHPQNQTGEQAQERAAKPVVVIPFELYHNRIYAPVQVSGQSLQMVVDTGATVSGVNITRTRNAGWSPKGKKAKMTGNGESMSSIELAKDVSLRIGDIELFEKNLALVPFDELESFEGRRIDGVLGVNLFHRYVVEINYGKKILSLYEPKTFSYSGHGTVVPLSINKSGTAATFGAVLTVGEEAPIASTLQIDSGTYSALRLFRPFVEKQHLLASVPDSVASFGFGIGGEFRQRAGRLLNMKVGALKINGPTAEFSQADKGATLTSAAAGTIGGEILRRFTVIFDYPHLQMILEPNANFTEPFLTDLSGLIVVAEGKDFETVRVRHVLPDSYAAGAGLREGDVLVSVNGRSAAKLGLEQLRELFRQPGSYKLTIQRGEQQMHLEMRTLKSFDGK